MARIRPIKPDLPRSEKLYEAEQETGLPIRFAVVGLLQCADREGRFEWKPRRLKLDCLPYDDVDMSRVLDVLVTCQTLGRYAADEKQYGYFVNWSRHMRVRNDEPESVIPPPPTGTATDTSLDSDGHVTPTSLDRHLTGEGEGRREEGKGRKEKGGRRTEGPPSKQTPTQMVRQMAQERDVAWSQVTEFIGSEPPWTAHEITALRSWLQPMRKYTDAELDQRRRVRRRDDGAGTVTAGEVVGKMNFGEATS